MAEIINFYFARLCICLQSGRIKWVERGNQKDFLIGFLEGGMH